VVGKKEDYKPQKAQKYTEGRLNLKEENRYVSSKMSLNLIFSSI